MYVEGGTITEGDWFIVSKHTALSPNHCHAMGRAVWDGQGEKTTLITQTPNPVCSEISRWPALVSSATPYLSLKMKHCPYIVGFFSFCEKISDKKGLCFKESFMRTHHLRVLSSQEHEVADHSAPCTGNRERERCMLISTYPFAFTFILSETSFHRTWLPNLRWVFSPQFTLSGHMYMSTHMSMSPGWSESSSS